MTYTLVFLDGKRCAKLSDPPQYMDKDELWQWMLEIREDNPDLYAELVPIYIQLTKGMVIQ